MKVVIYKLPDDPVCTRVSSGGKDDIGYYCTYRGNRDDAIKVLETVLKALIKNKADGPEQDTNRRFREAGSS